MSAALADVRGVIEHAITSRPRSLQKTIGPSGLGNPCTRCLAATLAGWDKTEDTAWLPFIGTSVHAELDVIFTMANADLDHARWWTERRVTVGTVGGVDITGTCDLYDHDTGTVVDFKVVGKSTLDQARRTGPTEQYRTQVNLYALGWTRQDTPVNQVAIAYLPRNAVSLDHAVWWSSPFEPDIAHAAISRADQLANLLDSLAAASTEARDAYIRSLPAADRCWYCPRYFPQPTGDPLDTLIGHLA